MLKELLQAGNTREGEDQQYKPKTIKKMVIGTYISIITLNVNGLNVPTKRRRLAEWIKKQDMYMLSTRDPLQTQGDIQTESEGMGKDIPCKWKSKESWSSNSHIRTNRL